MSGHLKRLPNLSDRSLSPDVVWALMLFALAVLWPEVVWADEGLSLGRMICNIDTNIAPFSPLFNAIAFATGGALVVKGVVLLKKHTENPNDSQIAKGVAHVLAGAALAALPTVAATIVETLHLTSSSGETPDLSCNPGPIVASATAIPLDVMLTNFIGNIKQPMHMTLSVLCFIMGVFLILRGLLKGSKMGSDPRVGAPHAIAANLLIGGIFTTVATMLFTMTNTLFGADPVNTFDGIINWTKITGGTEIGEVNKVVTAILEFIQIIGIIGFIRGWLIIKNAVEGTGQATIPQGMTHILGGTMAVNIGVMIRLLDVTFGTGLVNP